MTGERFDPVTFEVIWHRLLDTAEEMGIKYMRTSGSPVLVGAYDAATVITTSTGELVAMGPYITTQAHVQRMIIESVLRDRSDKPGIGPGDMFICNDPYLGATHQPDVATVAPVHDEGELRAWVGASGHWLDIGGPEPGGFNMLAKTIYDEGLRMPPTRIVDGGKIREDLIELILNQVREPLVELDLRGQIVANEAGRERLRVMFDEYGADVVEHVMWEGIAHVERRLRARLLELPDGVWREVQFLDHDGHRPNVRKIVCTLTKRADELTVDFTGSDSQVDGFANCTIGGVRAATLSAIGALLCYDLVWNDGVSRCVNLVVPPGTIVSAEHPTPVSSATITAIIVSLNLVFGAISKMLLGSPGYHDEAMANWCGASMAPTVTGLNDRGIMTVFPESSHFAAGCGARTYRDGVDTGGIIINTTANIASIEATEAEYPILYLFRRQLTDSGGAGRFRGGVSGSVALLPYDAGGPLESSFAGTGAEVPNAYGLAGGLPGACSRYMRFGSAGTVLDLARRGIPADEGEIPGEVAFLPINSQHTPLGADTVEFHNWQGGGGYGDPLDRDPKLVSEDVSEALVSAEMAKSIYGVVLSNGEVDLAGTSALRERIRRGRIRRGRPSEELLGHESEWDTVTGWVDEVAADGSLRYGDGVVFDFRAGQAICAKCEYILGDVKRDFRTGCLVEEGPTSLAGPARGQDYGSARVVLRLFYCPRCGRQLEAEVGIAEAPRASFRLASGLVSRIG